jgi:general secretion pathway protein F
MPAGARSPARAEMGSFQYRAADAHGKVVEGTLEAPEAAGVVAKLQERGLIPIRVSQAGAARRAPQRRLPLLRASRKPSTRDLVAFTQELAALVVAGLPLDRALGTVRELSGHPGLQRIVGDVLAAVRGGKGLADAMSEHDFFPPLYVNMVRAGEAGGFLETALQRLEEYLERSEELRNEVVSALIYPAFLMVSLGGSLVFMLVYVLPRFSALFKEMGHALPVSTQMVLNGSAVLRAYWWVGLVVVVVAVLLFRRQNATAAGRFAIDQTKLRLPGVGTILRKIGVSRLARTLGTLIKSGVPMVRALGIAREVAGNAVIARALDEVEVGVREGAGVAEPLARSGVFPQLAVQMIGVGEETGRLDDMLIRVADHYDRDVRVQLMRFTRLLEPVLILVMAGVIAFVVVSILQAILSLNDLPM